MPETTLRQFERERKFFSPLAIFVCCGIFTLLAWSVTKKSVTAEQSARFDRTVASLRETFGNRLNFYIHALVHTRNFVALHPHLTEQDFGKFIQRMNLKDEYPGIQNIGYVQRFTPETLRKALPRLPEISRGLLKNPKSGYDVVVFVQNVPGQGTGAKGMDVSVSEERLRAMNLAVDLGRPVATDRVQRLSVPEIASEQTFLVFVPHYREGVPLETIVERRRALLGFVYGSFKTPYLFGYKRSDVQDAREQLGIDVYDNEPSGTSKLMMDRHNFVAVSPQLEKTFSLNAAEHRWTVVVHGKRDFVPLYARWVPWIVLSVGMILTLVVTYSARRARIYAERLREDIRIRRETEVRLAEEKRIVELTAKIGTELKAEQDLESIVQMVTDVATDMVGAEFGAFFYKSPLGNETVTALSSLSGGAKSVFQGFQEIAFETREVLRLDKLREDPRGLQMQGLSVQSYLSAPVISRSGHLLGHLVFGHRETGVFSEGSERVARAIAIQAAVALDNAQLYTQLSEARSSADAANQAKSMFLANVSHEIRTPLGIMLGFAELTAERPWDAQFVEASLRKIIRNGRELTRIVGEVLDLSKIEANTLVIDRTQVDVEDFFKDLEQEWRPVVERKGIQFEVLTADDLPRYIYTDSTRLRQIVVNLLSNALKFTEKGFIQLSVTREASSSSLKIEVADSGIGISEEQQSRLFQSFSQGDESINRRFGGSGLGLALSKQLGQVLGGDLFLSKSFLGSGSRFVVELPIEEDRVASSVQRPSGLRHRNDLLESLRVLLVEDSFDNQALIKALLGRHQVRVETASDGEEGVRRALAEDYDLVLMDIQMPVLDGYSAFRRLRDSGYARPVIALTAHALVEERDKAFQLGFAGYLTKPLDRHLLIQTMVEVVGGQI